jgi:hypothetical protein
VIDDLRESILRHKCNVSIDDVECYALALSQLSKQLVGLKSSFSVIKDQLKLTEKLNDNKANVNNDVIVGELLNTNEPQSYAEKCIENK